LALEGLRTTQYSILSKLARLGPQSINTLAAMMVMDRTTTTRAVRPLARDSLVSIEAGEDGRTRVVAHPGRPETPKGGSGALAGGPA
jgi:DNA-binding MarR family transcriptional regulator